MRRVVCLAAGAFAAWALVTGAVVAQEEPLDAEEVDVGPALTLTEGLTQEEVVEELESGGIDALKKWRSWGLVVFTTAFNVYDGWGDGPWDQNELPPLAVGHRPPLQQEFTDPSAVSDRPFRYLRPLRVNGLDAQSCNECHNIVKHRDVPPQLGIGGVGGISQAAIIRPSVIDVSNSFDDRVVYMSGHDPDLPLEFDTYADFNGRFANPPFLFGGGGVELLAKEMTETLQATYAEAKADPTYGTPYKLYTHGVDFGHLESAGPGGVEFFLEGIGPEIMIDEDRPCEYVVVAPFGRKAERFSMRDFDNGAANFHFGMQPVETLDPLGIADEDGDGVVNELTVAEMSLLQIFNVLNPPPYEEELTPAGERGKRLFDEIGCASCHRPRMRTERRHLVLASPEDACKPLANAYYEVDLTEWGFEPDPFGTGLIIPLYSDLKRHDMGVGLEETLDSYYDLAMEYEEFELLRRVPNGEFVTARLWGVADTAPYLHDGRASTIYRAILMHGGEAYDAREKYESLSPEDQKAVLVFLRSLRVPDDPNGDIDPPVGL